MIQLNDTIKTFLKKKNLSLNSFISLKILIISLLPITSTLGSHQKEIALPSTEHEKITFNNFYQSKNHNNMDNLIINFDALKKSNWSEKELKNAALITDFIQNLMNNHDFDYVLKKYNNGSYLQHNRNIPDGFTAIVEYVKKFAKKFPEYTYDVKHIYADGDYITFHSHATVKKKHRGNPNKGFNIIDTWKVVDGEIVEHWDSIQAIDGFMRFYVWLTGGKTKNSNGLF